MDLEAHCECRLMMFVKLERPGRKHFENGERSEQEVSRKDKKEN